MIEVPKPKPVQMISEKTAIRVTNNKYSSRKETQVENGSKVDINNNNNEKQCFNMNLGYEPNAKSATQEENKENNLDSRNKENYSKQLNQQKKPGRITKSRKSARQSCTSLVSNRNLISES